MRTSQGIAALFVGVAVSAVGLAQADPPKIAADKLIDPDSCAKKDLWVEVVTDVFRKLGDARKDGRVTEAEHEVFALRFVAMQNELVERNDWAGFCRETLDFRLRNGF